jgi:hypothetical protein
MAFRVSHLDSVGDPVLQAALKSIEDALNQHGVIAGINPTGIAQTPQNAGNLTVTQANGVYDATITDSANQRGETYFLEWDTQASFATAHLIPLGPSRSWRGRLDVSGSKVWFRCYKQLQGSNPSPWINFSGNPLTDGGSAGPAPGIPKGSGSSNQAGRGFGTIGS